MEAGSGRTDRASRTFCSSGWLSRAGRHSSNQSTQTKPIYANQTEPNQSTQTKPIYANQPKPNHANKIKPNAKSQLTKQVVADRQSFSHFLLFWVAVSGMAILNVLNLKLVHPTPFSYTLHLFVNCVVLNLLVVHPRPFMSHTLHLCLFCVVLNLKPVPSPTSHPSLLFCSKSRCHKRIN